MLKDKKGTIYIAEKKFEKAVTKAGENNLITR
jgi:hypothetical protein